MIRVKLYGYFFFLKKIGNRNLESDTDIRRLQGNFLLNISQAIPGANLLPLPQLHRGKHPVQLRRWQRDDQLAERDYYDFLLVSILIYH